ncbi:hypothetical protein [Curtobacterium sp. Leaf261]|uniref:hypothetical protein n=1 Tax=Curtobacterium sp. Leaf261 TaxID=1736311 RepID=UPI0012E15723|nr:hypothetical protein [Curtobacterium sp. Leaf261]
MSVVRVLLSVASLSTCVVLLTGCSPINIQKDDRMVAPPTNSSAAKAAWIDLTTQIAATQQMVGGEWEVLDTNSRACGDGGASWVVARIGPGVPAADRRALADEVEAAWKAYGWSPVRAPFGVDAPGLRLRYPASGVLPNGFYIEFNSNRYASTIGAQTPCAAGDVDQLNREQFAFNNTPGYTPTPASSPTALTPTPRTP